MTDYSRTLDLSGKKHSWEPSPFRRPRINIDIIDYTPCHDGCHVVMHLEEQMGQPDRWVEMTSTEAREFTTHLLAIALQAERPLTVHPETEEPLEHASNAT